LGVAGGADGKVDFGANINRFNDAYFSGTVNADRFVSNTGDSNLASGFVSASDGLGGIAFIPIEHDGNAIDGQVSLGRGPNGGFVQYKFKDAYFSGTVNSNFVRMSSGLAVGTRDLIDTLSTLRNATKDETTLEGLRDAIGNAVGGLIEKFEAMQAEAVTQEISE
jgi:hypothetical protein